MRFQVGRAIWRDSAAILESSNRSKNTDADQPITKSFFESLISLEMIQKTTFRSNLFGMCTQPGQKKVYFYKHENFDAPAIYLENQSLLEKLKQGLSWAEDGREKSLLPGSARFGFAQVPRASKPAFRHPVQFTAPVLMRPENEFDGSNQILSLIHI